MRTTTAQAHRQPPPPGATASLTPPPPVGPSWWHREGITGRLLAIAGSVITLLGVVLLLVLAVQKGYLGPVPRVIGGAVLAGVLVGGAFPLRKRVGGELGAVALAATGTAGLYLDVLAATAFYGWLPTWGGLLLGFAIAAAGLTISHFWNSETFAVLAVVGAAVLSPILTGRPDPTLTSFLLVLSIAAGLLQLRHRWQVLLVARSAVPVVAAMLSLITVDRNDPSSAWFTVATCILVTIVGVGFAVHALYKDRANDVALAVLSISIAPTLISTVALHRWPATAVAAGLAIGLLALRFGIGFLPRRAQVVMTIAGAVAAFEAISIAGTLDSRAALLLVGATGLTVVAHQMRSKLALTLAVAYGVLGTLFLLTQVPPTVALDSDLAARQANWAGVLACLLLVVAAVALAYEVHFSGVTGTTPANWVVGAVAVLYGSTSAFVSAGVILSPTGGYVAGHTIATVTWMVAALVLLGKGLSRARLAVVARVAGLVLAAAAVAKLLLFDLAALDGIARVTGFIVVGLLLIAAGARYAKALAQQQTQQEAPQPGAAEPGAAEPGAAQYPRQPLS